MASKCIGYLQLLTYFIVNQLLINTMAFYDFLVEKLKEPKNNAAFVTINILLGVGPLIVPEPYFRAGFLFSTLWTILVFIISYNAAMYIGESIELLNEYDKEKSVEVSLIESSSSDKEQPMTDPQAPETKKVVEIIINDSSSDRDKQSREPQPSEIKSQTKSSDSDHVPTIRTYEHSDMIGRFYGQQFVWVPVVAISIYLFGVLISKCIMTGKVISQLFGDIKVISSFAFWLLFFFVIGGAFSFKSIEKTKVIQALMISVRFISIMLLLFGSIAIMAQNKGVANLSPYDGNPYFNGFYFDDVFSNLIFTFMFHHSLPGITKQLTEVKQIRQFLNVGFIAAGFTIFSVSITSNMAFGNDLIDMQSSNPHYLKYYNEDYNGRIDFIYYFVSFYVFLNVAAFSVYIIVIRKNILALARPDVDSDKVSKLTLVVTGVLLALLLVITWVVRDNIQVVLDFTGGILGAFNLLIMPSMQVYKARQLFPPKKSFLNSYVWFPLFMIVLGIIVIIYNLYSTIRRLA